MSTLKRHIVVRLLFLVVVLILTTHQIVPHHHHNVLSEEAHLNEHDSATSILDFLKLAFHEALGGDDLTTEGKSSDSVDGISLIFCHTNTFSFSSSTTQTTTTLSPFKNQSESIKSHFYLENTHFRAPPFKL